MRSIVMLLAAIGAAGLSAAWPQREASAWEEEFHAGEYWGGYASYNPDDGGFTFCAIYTDYPSGISVHIALSSTYELVLLLGNPAWRLTPGSEFPLALAVDERWSTDAVANASDDMGVIVSLGDDWEAYDALRRGRQLTVVARRQTFSFLLTGSAVALTEAARCVMDHRQDVAGGDPFSVDDGSPGGSTDPFGEGGTSPLGAKGASAPTRNSLASLLAIAGLEDVRMLSEAELEKDFPYADEAWIAGGIYGMLFVYANDGQSVEGMVDYQLSSLSRECGGRFRSGAEPDQAGARGVRRYFASCEEAGT